jgi:hypothetical protein
MPPATPVLQSPKCRIQLKKVAKVACRETKGTNGRGTRGWHTRLWSSEMSQKRKRQKRCLTASSAPLPPPVLHHLAEFLLAQCLLRIGRQVIAYAAVTPMLWQRNLNLCGSQSSSSESRRPLDIISVCPGRPQSTCGGF